MRNAFSRALGVAAGLSTVVLGATAASATAYTFDFSDSSNYNYFFGTWTGVAQNGATMSAKVTGWHANDSAPRANSTDSVVAASATWYNGLGYGVVYGNDNSSSGTHQVDNVGGGDDFLMIQFSQDVSLTSMGRYVFRLDGVSCCGSDASLWADTNNKYGSPSAFKTINLAGTTINEADFTPLAGGTGSGLLNTPVNNNLYGSVWMIAGAFNQSNDGFKLNNLVVNNAAPPAAVPEPASWAMMIVGFGAIGGSLRARRRSIAFA